MSCCEKIIEASRVMTDCECKAPGYCPVLKCTLNDYGHQLCRGTPGYIEFWKQNGGAPCMEGDANASKGHRVFGLGDAVAWLIRLVSFGLVTMCESCKGRKMWLNRHFPLWRRTR